MSSSQSQDAAKKDSSPWPAVWHMLKMLPGASTKLTVAAVVVLLAGILLPNAFRIATGALVGAVPEAARNGAGSEAANDVRRALIVLGIAFVAQQLIGPLVGLTTDALGRRLNGHLRARVMAASALPPGIAHLEDPATLDKVALAQAVGTANVTPRGVVGGVATLASNYGNGIAAGVLLLGFRWWLPIVVAAAYLLVIRRFRAEFHRGVQAITGRAETLRRSAYYRDVALTPAASKETRVFDMGRWVVARFRSSWTDAMTELWAERKGAWKTAVFAPAVFFAIEFGGMAMIALAAINGEISLGRMVVYVGAFGGLGAFANLGDHDLNIHWGAPSITAVEELEALTAAPPVAPGGAQPSSAMPADAIRLERVSFGYPGREELFNGLDLVIPAGKSLAIVGDNGAGKTTLVKLLARLYDPTGGRITVDGVQLTDLDPSGWQRRISAIFQDFTRYQITAAENIAYGAPERADDRDALRRAAERAGALDLIDGLAEGWDTVLSRQYKNGTDLSGGQWQRIALARAMFAVEAGAGVLILDEPTASLDVRAEAEVYDRFLELTRGLTTIVISHRFSTVRRADRIVVLADGQVAEDGTHEELLAAGGRYARMFRLQAARFTDGPPPDFESDELLEPADV
ncbi:MAG TPA: ABC transporter ATP-binding protein [Acidimicrobiales bacterium]|nr:ABC transporter ATP-binding protein [Acidimicrobiales bacterium]